MKCEVLDHGYVEFIESWGTGKDGLMIDNAGVPWRRDTEVGIIEAARQSTQGSFRGWLPDPCNCDPDSARGPNNEIKYIHSPECDSVKNPGDARLLKFLYEHKHLTPFEFSGMTLEVQAPIFVFREWHRHRTQSYNEMSARYAPLPDLYYTPSPEHVLARGTSAKESKNRQSQGLNEMSPMAAGPFVTNLQQIYNACETVYQQALAAGIPKELARLVMPVGHYSRMRASANLRNWLAFVTLRTDPAAQWEIRQYAHAVAEFIKRTFPMTYDLWEKAK